MHLQLVLQKSLVFHAYSRELWNLFWDSFTNHKTENYLRHGINITTNQMLSLMFRGNGNTINDGDSQTSLSPIFSEGSGASVHRLTKTSSRVKIMKAKWKESQQGT